MKNLSKQQLAVVIVSILAILLLAFQVIRIDSSSNEGLQERYKATLDSIKLQDSLITNFPKEVQVKSDDIFNFKIVQVKKAVQQTANDTVKVVKTKWISNGDLELYKKDKIAYSFFFNGKARFTINGKTQEVKVGDVVALGSTLSKEVVVGTNEPTGNTKVGKEYSNKILSITERSVYVDSDDKDRVVRFRPNSDATFFARNLMNESSSPNDSKEGTSEPTETQGRRNSRGGGR